MRKVIIPAAIMLGITTFGINEYNNYQNEQLIDRIRKSEYNPRTMIEVKLEEIRKQEEMDKKIQEQIDKIAEYKRSDEYKLREETRHWREELGISIDEIKPIAAELSFYSSLPCENGIYGLKTASGTIMDYDTVANNFLPFGTNVYIEGYGLKTVEDRGSTKYFNTENKFDVYIPRNKGEDDKTYLQRINSYGRKTVNAYVIK